jgi:hypothetical protein
MHFALSSDSGEITLSVQPLRAQRAHHQALLFDCLSRRSDQPIQEEGFTAFKRS